MVNKNFWPGMLVMALTFGMMVIGCENGTGTTEPQNLPVESKLWELGEDGFIQWYSNDPQDLDTYSRKLYDNLNETGSYEIECKKMSGNRGWGYGMIFEASDDVSQYYCITINAYGSFHVIKKTSGESSSVTIKDWTVSTNLYAGYNRINSIKVVKSGTVYDIYLNGAFVYQFTDNTVTGNKIGYIVYVGTSPGTEPAERQESFPNTPVDVRFRQK
jgi:hypothetical protein